MSTLHNALKSLAPITFAELPTSEADLDVWVSHLFSQAQLIIDSIPIGDASEPSLDPKSSTSSVASNASEITLSSARPAAPRAEHQALQKEWGKAVKLGAKENALGMSVYKASGKDGKGAWFARRSVHEGISFTRFKKALEQEFPESLAVQGAPGEGNVRGIGGETRVEDIKIPSKGRVEVYRLSAQFPGPTTPRDFVTMLVTSENALTGLKEGDSVPRHYMIISKPCDHPETQPQSGFVRGFYESVEFIREVPRQVNSGHTATDPSHSPATEEIHPVEWIMVTRSDPGGSVPRFMVERGTPGSICADAEKFLNWACQQDFDNLPTSTPQDPATPSGPIRRESFQPFRSSRTAGVEGEGGTHETVPINSQVQAEGVTAIQNSESDATQSQSQGGLFGAVTGAASYLGLYSTPAAEDGTADVARSQVQTSLPKPEEDTASVASFESADSHIESSESEKASIASKSTLPRKSGENLTAHEKELMKLDERRAALQTKFTEDRAKLDQGASTNSAKDEAARQKILDKHEKEIQKQKEKYEKELKKIEQRQEKEKKKMEEKNRKEADKDEKGKLTRERDEARKEADLFKKEADVLRTLIDDLQKQNTDLVAKLNLAEASIEDGRPGSQHSSYKKGHAASGSTSTSVKSQ